MYVHEAYVHEAYVHETSCHEAKSHFKQLKKGGKGFRVEFQLMIEVGLVYITSLHF